MLLSLIQGVSHNLNDVTSQLQDKVASFITLLLTLG